MRRAVIIFVVSVLFFAKTSYCQEPAIIDSILCQKAEAQYPGTKEKVEGAIIRINFNRPVECAIYEISDPYRIVVKPSTEVYAGFKEQKIELSEGIVKEIHVIKSETGAKPKLGEPFYPIDYVVISPVSTVKHKIIQKGNVSSVYLGDIDESADNY